MKMRFFFKVFFVCLVMAILYSVIPSMCVLAQTTVVGDIVVDGSMEDWDNVSSRASSDSCVSDWKAAVGVDGTLFFCYTGTGCI